MSDKYTVEDAPAQSKYTVEDAAPPAPQQSWWDRVTAPYTEIQKPDPNAPAFSGKEAIKAVGNIGAGGLGVILHPYNTLKSVGRMALETAPPVALAEKYLMHQNPSGEEMGQQFADNPYGTIEAGIGQAGAAPIFQGEVTAPIKAARIIPKIAKGGMDILAGTTPKVATELGAKTLEDNAAAQAKADAANAKATQKHLEDTQDALHQTRGNELQYQQNVNNANEAARKATAELDAKHASAVQDAIQETREKEDLYRSDLAKARLESEETYQKKLKEVDAERAKTAQKHKDEVSAYLDKKTKIQQQHQDALTKYQSDVAKQQKIAPTQTKLDEATSNLRAGIETARNKALQFGNEKYNTVNSELNMHEADPVKTRLILDEAADTLPGSDAPPLVKSFDQRINGMGKDGMPLGPMTYDELQSYYSKLGNALSKGTLDGETYHAYDVMHDAIGEEMKAVAKRADAAEVAKGNEDPNYASKLKEAQDYWRRMKQTFGKPYNASDAATATLKGINPDFLTADTQANRLRLLGSFDPDIPRLAQHVQNLQAGVDALPKPTSARVLTQNLAESKKPLPVPPSSPATIPAPEPIPPRQVAAPARTEIPDRPLPVEPEPIPLPKRVAPPDKPIPVLADVKKVGLKDIQQAKQDVMMGKKGPAGGKLGHLAAGAGAWHILSSAMYGNPEGVALGAAVGAAPYALARVLKSPGIVRMLSEPTPADIAAIPPEVRGDLPAIVDAAQKQGVKVHPSILLMARPNAPQQ